MVWRDNSWPTKIKRPAYLTLALLGTCLLAALGAPHAASTGDLPPDITWRLEIVDDKGTHGGAMALDDHGFPHIAYDAEGFPWRDLKYARWTGSQWVLQKVADMELGGATAIALKSVTSTAGISVYPHISYSACNPFYCAPRYAEWTGDEWVITTTVEGNGSLVIDTNGDPHLSYSYGVVAGSISQKYAHRTGSNWEATTIEDGLPTWTYSSLELDSHGYPHISYYGNGYLKYARWSGSSWISETLESNEYAGLHTSLALDASDHPHISYYDWNHKDLRYAVWTGSDWILQTVDSAGDVGAYTSLALDSKGYPHIAYRDATNAALKYARWTGTHWRVYTVDTDVPDYTDLSLALDAYDRPRIAYRQSRANSEGLKFAWGQPLRQIYLLMMTRHDSAGFQ